MTQNLPMQSPTSNDPAGTLWTRRNVLLAVAFLTVLPVLFGAAVYLLSDGTKSFWVASWRLLNSEITGIFMVFATAQAFPRVQRRLGMPNPYGDERERLIALKSTRFTFILTVALMMVGLITFLIWGALNARASVGVPDIGSAINWVMLTVLSSHYGSMIYYNRKM